MFKISITLTQTQYLDQFKWKPLMENSVDFSTTREFFGTDFRACSFDTLLQVLSKCRDHPMTKVHTNSSNTATKLSVIKIWTKFRALVADGECVQSSTME